MTRYFLFVFQNIIKKVNGQKFVYKFVSLPDSLAMESDRYDGGEGEWAMGKASDKGLSLQRQLKATTRISSRNEYMRSGLYSTFTIQSLQSGSHRPREANDPTNNMEQETKVHSLGRLAEEPEMNEQEEEPQTRADDDSPMETSGDLPHQGDPKVKTEEMEELDCIIVDSIPAVDDLSRPPSPSLEQADKSGNLQPPKPKKPKDLELPATLLTAQNSPPPDKTNPGLLNTVVFPATSAVTPTLITQHVQVRCTFSSSSRMKLTVR